MRIGINALAIKIGGGVTFLRNILPYLLEHDKDNEYIIFVTSDNLNDILGDSKLNKRIKIVQMNAGNLLVRMLLEQFLLPFFIMRHKISILICSGNIISFFAPCKKMLWILNIDPFTALDLAGENLVRKMRNLILRVLTLLSIRHSNLAVFISEYSRRSASKLSKLDRSKTRVIYLGVANDLLPQVTDAKTAVSKKYILSVSTISKRKNYEALLRAYAELPKEIIGKYELMLVGKVSEEYRTELLSLIKDDEIAQKIQFKGMVNSADLRNYYHNASLFILPSLVESFGLPVIEAMASGVPVIVSNATSLPEIAWEAALVFDPHDPKDLADKIIRVLQDDELARKIAKAGTDRAAQFTWDNTAQETIKCYREIMGNID
jgi:glycosyltransferase involved in cell wall biosynthesis